MYLEPFPSFALFSPREYVTKRKNQASDVVPFFEAETKLPPAFWHPWFRRRRIYATTIQLPIIQLGAVAVLPWVVLLLVDIEEQITAAAFCDIILS